MLNVELSGVPLKIDWRLWREFVKLPTGVLIWRLKIYNPISVLRGAHDNASVWIITINYLQFVLLGYGAQNLVAATLYNEIPTTKTSIFYFSGKSDSFHITIGPIFNCPANLYMRTGLDPQFGESFLFSSCGKIGVCAKVEVTKFCARACHGLQPSS